MVKCRRYAAKYAIRQSLLGSNIHKQPGGKAAAKKLVQYFHCIVIRVAALDAQSYHLDRALVYITLFDEINAWFRLWKRNLRPVEGLAFGQTAECVTQLAFHGLRIKVARDSQ